MTTFSTIGSGLIGGTVARLAAGAGYDVVVSNSREPETLAALVAELGPNARAATPTEAATAGDIVLVSVPLKAYLDVPVDPLAGKVVLDTFNYYPQRDGAIAELDDKRTTTSRLLQDHLPQSRVVKAFNNIFYEHLASLGRPAGAEDRNTLFLAGDDPDAKKIAAEFLDSIGYDAYDTGGLDDSWRYERDQPAYANAYAEDGDFAHPVRRTASELQELLDHAER